MKIYRITDNRKIIAWDVWIGAIVVANDPEDAKRIHPGGGEFIEGEGRFSWVNKYSEIDVDEIGEANPNLERGVVLDSYCAG